VPILEKFMAFFFLIVAFLIDPPSVLSQSGFPTQ